MPNLLFNNKYSGRKNEISMIIKSCLFLTVGFQSLQNKFAYKGKICHN